MVQRPDGTLRLLTYGSNSETLLNGTATLFVRTKPAPEGLSGWQVINLKDYRELATAFDGTPVNATCLGGPCFEFPKAATDAILANAFGENFEIWLSGAPSAIPSEARDWGNINVIRPQILRRLRGETE
jgi:hypothetical protein